MNFDWDTSRSSKKLQIVSPANDCNCSSASSYYTGDSIVVKDGSGFKNAIGDYVRKEREGTMLRNYLSLSGIA